MPMTSQPGSPVSVRSRSLPRWIAGALLLALLLCPEAVIWSHKKGERMAREGAAILSAKLGEFRVQEGDGSITTLTQLE